MNEDPTLGFDDALVVVRDLVEEFTASTGRLIRSIVAVGGTALAAHAIRERSGDVDLYLSDIDDDVLDRVRLKFVPVYGQSFKIDATPSNTVWGAIALLDIEESPTVRLLATRIGTVSIRALTPETLYIMKVAANRAKDQPDLAALADRTHYEAVVRRARIVFPWYADRGGFPEQVERLARYLARDFRVPLEQVDIDLALPLSIQVKIREIRAGLDLQFLNVLRALMTRHHHLLTFDANNPQSVSFDARSAGAGDEVLALMDVLPDEISDMAARVLKQRDPTRHLARLAAIQKLRRPTDQ